MPEAAIANFGWVRISTDDYDEVISTALSHVMCSMAGPCKAVLPSSDVDMVLEFHGPTRSLINEVLSTMESAAKPCALWRHKTPQERQSAWEAATMFLLPNAFGNPQLPDWKQAVVVGAGLAGISIASCLVISDVNMALLEKEERAGGGRSFAVLEPKLRPPLRKPIILSHADACAGSLELLRQRVLPRQLD